LTNKASIFNITPMENTLSSEQRERVEWLRRAAASGDCVGVVDRSGLLVNVGVLSASNDVRKVVFSSAQSSGVADVWLDVEWAPGEDGYRLVPVTPERAERWDLIHRCREVAWSRLPDEVLRMILAAIPGQRSGREGG